MNKLLVLEDMGFNITWKLIDIGVNGYKDIFISLTYKEIIDYLETKISERDLNTDKYVSLICEEDDFLNINKLLIDFSVNDKSDIKLQIRKWRVFFLKEVLDNISSDHLQGLLQLMEFWISPWSDDDCPMLFPKDIDFFSEETYEYLIQKNIIWLNNEIAYIRRDQSGDG